MSADSSDPDLVELGFVEKVDPWRLTNRFFPSKIGGRPAWLDLKNIPSTGDIACPKCGQPRVFLCQVYSPLEFRDDCFHRTIYLFICKNESCYELNSAENIVAFRSQLPRINDFYSSEAPNEDEEMPEIECKQNLCCVCGCHGSFKCSKCKKINYCSKFHQKIDWSHHKSMCQKLEETVKKSESNLLFPEYNMIVDLEEISPNTETSDINADEEKRLEEYMKLVETGKAGDLNDIPEKELLKFMPENIDDKQFRKFHKTIKYDQKQVLRYQRNGEPLWISSKSIINQKDVPRCEYCGSERIFEFQVMPQLLNYLKDDNVDWGILAVFTCSNSCQPKSQYLKEFVFKQDVTV